MEIPLLGDHDLTPMLSNWGYLLFYNRKITGTGKGANARLWHRIATLGLLKSKFIDL